MGHAKAQKGLDYGLKPEISAKLMDYSGIPSGIIHIRVIKKIIVS
jgi:hypothetical protein